MSTETQVKYYGEKAGQYWCHCHQCARQFVGDKRDVGPCPKCIIENLESQLKIARDALEWYAVYAETTEINYDLGKRAKEALAKLKQ